MTHVQPKNIHFTAAIVATILILVGLALCSPGMLVAQSRVEEDPAEPLQGRANPRLLPRPAGAMQRRGRKVGAPSERAAGSVRCAQVTFVLGRSEARRRLRARPSRRAPQRNC